MSNFGAKKSLFKMFTIVTFDYFCHTKNPLFQKILGVDSWCTSFLAQVGPNILGPKDIFLKYLLLLLCKISKNYLEWILRRRRISFWDWFGVNMFHFYRKQDFFARYSFSLPFLTYIAQAQFKISKISLEQNPRTKQMSFLALKWDEDEPLWATGKFPKNWAASLFSICNYTTVNILKDLFLFKKSQKKEHMYENKWNT